MNIGIKLLVFLYLATISNGRVIYNERNIIKRELQTILNYNEKEINIIEREVQTLFRTKKPFGLGGGNNDPTVSVKQLVICKSDWKLF